MSPVSAADIASKLAYITGQLHAGGTNAQMKEWYEEYKKLNVELQATKAAQAAKTHATGPPPPPKKTMCSETIQDSDSRG
ncbi:hypothetical protein QQS21_011270 [Conoideocrella luteorostrata]|uniref:Uncharacterized protein n=1 Tax=Conoideocrella luteorostrata TaxID=1105319 RepID=A0AAJ0CDE3_9HYPO|nr:hypothetical protein QQS21_011270 [Conoideocrella luteorostrata]